MTPYEIWIKGLDWGEEIIISGQTSLFPDG